MSIGDRSMQTVCQGPLAGGAGKPGHGSRGALDGLALTWASRTEQPGGKITVDAALDAALELA